MERGQEYTVLRLIRQAVSLPTVHGYTYLFVSVTA